MCGRDIRLQVRRIDLSIPHRILWQIESYPEGRAVGGGIRGFGCYISRLAMDDIKFGRMASILS